MVMRLMEFADFILAISTRSVDQPHFLGICCFLVESLLTITSTVDLDFYINWAMNRCTEY